MKEIINTIGIDKIIIYFILINLLGFLAMLIDKRKAEKGYWRIPEKTLFMFCVLGGGIGTILGMYVFRHKTQKLIFKIGMPLILVCEILLVVWLFVA